MTHPELLRRVGCWLAVIVAFPVIAVVVIACVLIVIGDHTISREEIAP
jgi:hypothetical protein